MIGLEWDVMEDRLWGVQGRLIKRVLGMVFETSWFSGWRDIMMAIPRTH